MQPEPIADLPRPQPQRHTPAHRHADGNGPDPGPGLRHLTVEGPAGPLHLVEQGTGPLVLLEGDLDVYAGEFGRTGFTGALNRYRAVDRDREDLAPYRGARSSSRPCSSAAPWTPPPPGCPRPSTPTPPPSPVSRPRTAWTAAATGSSRSARTRSTAC